MLRGLDEQAFHAELRSRPSAQFAQELDLAGFEGSQVQPRLAVLRFAAGQQEVQDRSQAEDVGAMVDQTGRETLLGGHVIGRAHDGFLGHVHPLRFGQLLQHVDVEEPRVVRLRGQELRQSEIGHVDVAVRPDQDIRRLQVPVDDALVVSALERQAELAQHPQESR